nr:MAG TPA: hypothetical protein [Siphoviridae sp. ctEdl3]
MKKFFYPPTSKKFFGVAGRPRRGNFFQLRGNFSKRG